MYLETDLRVYWKTFNGQKYLLFDFSNLDSKEFFAHAVNSANLIKKEKENSVISLLEISNSDISFNTILTIKKLSKQSQNFVKKSAIVSETEKTRLLFQLYKKVTDSKAQLFTSREEALEYLFETE